MKKTLFHFLFLFFLFAVPLPSAHGQPSTVQCIANIQKRLDALGSQTHFDYNKAREIMKDFDFGKLSDAVADPKKGAAFKRVFTSLSEFCDAAGNTFSAKGMRGFTKSCGYLIDAGDDVFSAKNMADLKKAFSKSSGFQGTDFDALMTKLDDINRFTFDSSTRTIKSKSGYKLGPENYNVNLDKGGEKTALTHILRGHLDNGSVTSNTSKFFRGADIPDLLDEAWEKIKKFRQNPSSSPDVQLFNGQANAYIVKFKDQAGNPRSIGRNINNTADTSKMRIFANGANGSDFIRTAFPD